MKIFTSLKANKYKIFAFIFWIMVWQILSNVVSEGLLLPTPFVTFKRFFELLFTVDFWITIVVSIFSIYQGLLLGLFVGCALALLSFKFKTMNAIISPFITVTRAVPVACIIILCLVFISTKYLSAFICFLMVVPIVYQPVLEGIKNTDKQLLEMAKVFDFSRYKYVKYIYIKAVMPYFKSACKNAVGFAWKAGIATEILARPSNSIGFYINEAKTLLMSEDLFAWTIAIIIISLLTEKIVIKLVEKSL